MIRKEGVLVSEDNDPDIGSFLRIEAGLGLSISITCSSIFETEHAASRKVVVLVAVRRM